MNLDSKLASSNLSLGEYSNFAGYIIQGVVFVILIVYFFVPSYHTIQELRTTIDEKKNTLADVTEYASYLKQLANSTIDVEESIVNYAFPSENDVVTLILTYEGLASQNEEVEVSSISLTPGVLEQQEEDLVEGQIGTQQVEFSMKVTTEDPEAARTFIDQITKTRRIFDIQSLSWTEPNAESPEGETDLNIDISLVTYYYIEGNTSPTRGLVRQGQGQQEFISQLRNGTVFEDLILEGAELGKDDLFVKESTQSARI